ncbi:MAG: galactosyldiacylglycerol synthase [Chloroflexi bacterium]|nr:galactosyldiacylglycerol synthase [Chloroflexota bacterium]
MPYTIRHSPIHPSSFMPHRIVLLMSDTGGGHRASAEAIQEALKIKCGENVNVKLVDVFKDYTPYPFNRFPAWYPIVIARGIRAWGPGFKASDGRTRTRVLTGAVYPYTRPAFKQMIHDHPADIYVSVHPLLTMPAVRPLGKNRPPFVTVVTDLVSAHAFWYYPKVDEIIVPTEGAYQRAIKNKVPPEKLKVIGLPVSQKFCAPAGDKAALRKSLNWNSDRITVLVEGGGEGMGPLKEIARGIASSGMDLQLTVVCGRNEALRQELEAMACEIPTHLYGFVTIMPEMMRAADLIVTMGAALCALVAVSVLLPYGCSKEKKDAAPEGQAQPAADLGKDEIYCGGRRGIVGALAAKSGECD